MQKTTPIFNLAWENRPDQWQLEFVAKYPFNQTSHFPQTSQILEQHLPSIFKAECFNPDNIPFYEELKHTESGHLFEHILLEHLCLEKLKSNPKACFSGKTQWDLERPEAGEYQIFINKEAGDEKFFRPALARTQNIMNQIFASQPVLAKTA